MDIEGLERLLGRLESGEVRVVCRDLTQPSPLALEALSAKPYAFLDDAPLEERRTQAVMARRWQDPQNASDLGRLDPEAIAAVRAEAWPDPVNAEELHDALLWLGFVTEAEARLDPAWAVGWARSAADRARDPNPRPWDGALGAGGAGEQFRALWPEATLQPEIDAPAEEAGKVWTAEEALVGDPARAARRVRAGHGDRARGVARAPAGGRRRRARRARGGRRDPARPLRSGRERRAMVRPAAARPHAPPHRQSSAGGDRAGRAARFPALPVRLAACRRRRAPRRA